MDGHGRHYTESVALPVLRFLRMIFSEPDDALFDFVQSNKGELLAIGIEPDESLTLGQMQIEYTRLFLGPKNHHPPYKSIFTEGTFWGAATDDVNQFMKKYGLSLNGDNSTPPDHAALLFEILEKILTSKLPERQTLYQEFLRKHLSWMFDFLQEIIEISRLQIYKSGFAFARVFLKEELAGSA